MWVGSQARREAEAKAAALVESLRLVKAKDLIDADGFVQFQDSDMHEAVCSALQLSENEKVPARRMAEITRLMVNRSIPMGRMVPPWSVFQLMPQLEELYLDSYASLEGIQALQLCPKLRSLYLFRIKKIPWDELTTLPELSSLSLVDMPAESLALEKIAQFLKAPIDLSLEQIEGECDLTPLNQGIDSLQLWKGDYEGEEYGSCDEYAVEDDSEEQAARIREAFSHLTATQQRRLRLYADGKTLREIAAIEETSFQSVAESIEAGRKKFLKFFSSDTLTKPSFFLGIPEGGKIHAFRKGRYPV